MSILREKIMTGYFKARAKFHNGKTEPCTVQWKMAYHDDKERAGKFIMLGHKLEYEIKPETRPKDKHSFYGMMLNENVTKVVQEGPDSPISIKLVKKAIDDNEDRFLFRFVNRLI